MGMDWTGTYGDGRRKGVLEAAGPQTSSRVRRSTGLPGEVRSSTRPGLRRDLAAARHEHPAQRGRLGYEGKLVEIEAVAVLD